jgi:phosphate transport system permease protein
MGLVKKSLTTEFPEVNTRADKRKLYGLVSSGAAFDLQNFVKKNRHEIGNTIRIWVPADDDVDMLMKGHILRAVPEIERRMNDAQIGWVDHLLGQSRIKQEFNTRFFTGGDSREPELAGIWGATCGSLYTLLVTLCLSFPIGVATAVYLEEFAPTNRWTDVVEVNINNLAAVPSIVFGLLGLAVFLNFFGLPRSAPLVGGLVLTLMTLPTIIIASRASLKSVPPSIREAALGIGASKTQMVAHHVLPLAMPGMLTGTIIGMAQALGETAPLLMIGMVAFIVDIPAGFTDPATVLPVQIFLWADSPERAFLEKTSAAIMVLLCFLVAMNGLAVVLRKKFERRW